MTAKIFSIQKFSLHDGPGIRTAIFFYGCNLRCKWCANPEAFTEDMTNASVKEYTLDEVMSEVLKDKAFYESSGGGVTLTGGEAMLHEDFVLRLCDNLREEGISIAIETAANIANDVFTRIIQKCGYALIDLKHWDNKKHIAGTQASNRLIIENIQTAVKNGVNVTVRIPVIPGFNDSPSDARLFSELLLGIGVKNVNLLPFHQLGEGKYEKLGIPYAFAGVSQTREVELKPFADIFEKKNLNVQIGG